MNYFVFNILKTPYIGRLLAKIVAKNTGGEMTSLFLREYTKQLYNVNVGLYSYGGCFRSSFCLGGELI